MSSTQTDLFFLFLLLYIATSAELCDTRACYIAICVAKFTGCHYVCCEPKPSGFIQRRAAHKLFLLLLLFLFLWPTYHSLVAIFCLKHFGPYGTIRCFLDSRGGKEVRSRG